LMLGLGYLGSGNAFRACSESAGPLAAMFAQ
jgi:hypothetical protein